MTRVRLLPIVVAATTALLMFKMIGLVTHGGYVLTGTLPVAAQSAPAGAAIAPANVDQAAISSADAAAAGRAADTLFSAVTTPTADPAARPDALPVTATADGKLVDLTSSDGAPLTDKQILERLSQRRDELDKRAASLDARQAIVVAAEDKLQQRIDALKSLEAKVDALVAEKKAMEDKQFAGLVSMYESMRPTDAANIFNKLSMDILVKLSSAINPRKLALVVAKMDPSVAQQLTVQLVDAGGQGNTYMAAAGPKALPQIVGK